MATIKSTTDSHDLEVARFRPALIGRRLLNALIMLRPALRDFGQMTGLWFAIGTIVATSILIAPTATAQSDVFSKGLTVVYGSPDAPTLALPDIDDNIQRLEDQSGKVVVINFWATWCPPCRAEMPSMQRAYNVLDRNRFEIFAINIGDKDPAIKEFVAEIEPALTFPILRGEPDTMELWNIKGLPTTYFVDKQGRIIYVAMGGRDLDSDHITERIQALMDAPE